MDFDLAFRPKNDPETRQDTSNAIPKLDLTSKPMKDESIPNTSPPELIEAHESDEPVPHGFKKPCQQDPLDVTRSTLNHFLHNVHNIERLQKTKIENCIPIELQRLSNNPNEVEDRTDVEYVIPLAMSHPDVPNNEIFRYSELQFLSMGVMRLLVSLAMRTEGYPRTMCEVLRAATKQRDKGAKDVRWLMPKDVNNAMAIVSGGTGLGVSVEAIPYTSLPLPGMDDDEADAMEE